MGGNLSRRRSFEERWHYKAKALPLAVTAPKARNVRAWANGPGKKI